MGGSPQRRAERIQSGKTVAKGQVITFVFMNGSRAWLPWSQAMQDSLPYDPRKLPVPCLITRMADVYVHNAIAIGRIRGRIELDKAKEQARAKGP